MIVSKMKGGIVLLALICFEVIIAEQSLVETEHPGVCTNELQGTLEDRVNQADVVLTGTIRRLETESRGSGKSVEIFDVAMLAKAAEKGSSTRTVAIVELWQVVKGSISEVVNQTSGIPDSSDDGGVKQNSFLKLYGLWNAQLCGSSLFNGDTRIFFLKKFRDVREFDNGIGMKSNYTDRMKSEVRPVILRTGEADVEENNTELGELKEMEPPKRGKKKNNKNEKNKRNGKKRNRKKNRKRKDKSERGRRRKRKSESMRGKLERLSNRQKRSSMVPNKIDRKFRKRQLDGDQPRSVLVLNAAPARITLTNLNIVDDLSKLL